MKKHIFLMVVAYTASTAYSQVCQDNIIQLLSQKGSQTLASDTSKIESVLGKLNDKQTKALQKYLNSAQKEVYTATDLAEQEKTLKKVGFSDSDITTLRKEGLINNSVTQLARPLPKSIQAVETDMQKFGVEEARKMQKGESIPYILADDGTYHFPKKELDLSEDSVWIAKRKTPSGEGTDGFLIRETGSLSFNPKSKKFEFNPSYGTGATQKEINELAKTVESATGQKVELATSKVSSKETKAYECLDILSAQVSGKNFILNRAIPDNAVTVAGIAVGEALGAGRLNSQQGREVIAADLIGTNINVLVSGYIGSKLVLSRADFLTALGTRAAVGTGMIDIQKNVYENMISQQAKQRAEKIATFDQYHFAGKLVWNHMFEKFLVGGLPGKMSLPDLIFKACQSNSKMKVLVNPQMVRLAERSASAAVYYGLRKSVIDE